MEHHRVLLTPSVSPSPSDPSSTTQLISRPSITSSPPSRFIEMSDSDIERRSSTFIDPGRVENGGITPKSSSTPKSNSDDVQLGSREKRPSSLADVNANCGPMSMVWPPRKRRDGWTGWMGDTVTSQSLVWSLITHAFATGILDATTYLDFNTFASNQTGNTIILTVSVVRLSGHILLLTGVSFSAFVSSALLFGQIGHIFGVRRRAWLLSNLFYQLICLVLAAIFLSPDGPSATRLGGKHEWAVILLFGSMSGAQVAAARQASIQEIPTAPMTSTYVDLVSDQYLFAGFRDTKGAPRNRRLGYVLAMIIGSFIGGIMHKYAGSWAVVLVAMFFKLVVVVMISLAPAEPRSNERR